MYSVYTAYIFFSILLKSCFFPTLYIIYYILCIMYYVLCVACNQPTHINPLAHPPPIHLSTHAAIHPSTHPLLKIEKSICTLALAHSHNHQPTSVHFAPLSFRHAQETRGSHDIKVSCSFLILDSCFLLPASRLPFKPLRLPKRRSGKTPSPQTETKIRLCWVFFSYLGQGTLLSLINIF